mgnify:CR=1 FL=1
MSGDSDLPDSSEYEPRPGLSHRDADWSGTEAYFLMQENLLPVCSPALLDGQSQLSAEQIANLPQDNRKAIELIVQIIARGEAEGTFRKDIDPVELHLNMTALSFYNVSNQYTFAHNFGIDMTSDAAVERRASQVADIIIAWVTRLD